MKIGLLVTSIGNFGNTGFYNTQEIGLAKALDTFGDEVCVYKLVNIKEKYLTEHIKGCKDALIKFIPSKKIGNNGIFNIDLLDKDLEALIYFSDIQLMVSAVDKWARKNRIKLYPYIGVLESHSNKKFIKIFMNWLFLQNIKIYKKRVCLAKTPTVKKNLEDHGVNNVKLTPVGLDKKLLQEDFRKYDIENLKNEFGYRKSDIIVLFVGRLTDEKRPLQMIDIFVRLINPNVNYRLLMIGTGDLRGTVITVINKMQIRDKVQLIDKIPNSEMWKIYRIADVFVNLNQQEIFGMSILEAMYYECKVVAWDAPGPRFIIENGITGYIGKNDKEIELWILSGFINQEKVQQKINNYFLWDVTAKKIKKAILDCC